jgi:hypothetical protein
MKTITDWGKWFVDQKYPYEFELGNCRKMFDHVQRTEAIECGKRYKGFWSPSDWVKANLLGAIQKAGELELWDIGQYIEGTWLGEDRDIVAALVDELHKFKDHADLYKQRDSGKGF